MRDLELLSPQSSVSNNPAPQGSGTTEEVKVKRLEEPGAMEDTKESRPSTHNRAGRHMNSENVLACTGPAEVCCRYEPRAERRSRYSLPYHFEDQASCPAVDTQHKGTQWHM